MNGRGRWMLLIALGVFVLSGCGMSEQGRAEKEAADAELKQLEGKWKIAAREGEISDDDDSPEARGKLYWVIENGILREEFKTRDGSVEVLSRRKLVLMPTRTPKGVDLVYVDANGKEIKERPAKKLFRGKKRPAALKDVGVYRLEGDTLEMCISSDDRNRPPDFTAPAGSSRYLMKLERMREEK